MKAQIKACFCLVLILGSLLISAPSYSSPFSFTDMNNIINDMPVYSAVFPGSVGALLCDIKRLFCGKLTQVIIATSIFVAGILILNRKMNWMNGIVIVLCSLLLVHPETLGDLVMRLNLFGFSVGLGWIADICICFQFSTGNGCNPLCI